MNGESWASVGQLELRTVETVRHVKNDSDDRELTHFSRPPSSVFVRARTERIIMATA